MGSKIKFELDEGIGSSTLFVRQVTSNTVVLDELCQKFLDFLDEATYCNSVEILIKDKLEGDIVLKNNPKT